MRLIHGVLLAAIMQMWAAGAAVSAEWGAYSTARVDDLVESFRKSSSLPALSIALGVDGRLVFAKGYGEARPGIPATEHSVYHIGSLTKQFTAAAVLSLVASEAKAPLSAVPMTLGTPVAEILHGVEGWAASGQPAITLRGLLTMTSALPSLADHPPVAADPWGRLSAARMLDELRKLPVTGSSNTFQYSNTNYFLLAQIIEATRGLGAGGYRQFLKTALIEKAGMRDTGFIGDYAADTQLAVAVPSWGSRTPASRRRPAFVEPDWLMGSADMASSAYDLFVWNKALMEARIVGTSGREMMFSDAARVGRSRYYGMGWFVEHTSGADQYSHTGYVPGYSSLNYILRFSSGPWFSVSLLTNSDGVENLDELAAAVAQVAVGRDWTKDRYPVRGGGMCSARLSETRSSRASPPYPEGARP